MGRIGRVVKSYIDKLSGSGKPAQHVAVEEFAGDERKAQVFGPCNEDFAPPESAKSVDVAIGRGRGFLAAIAWVNELIAPQAKAGERRIYSTNAAGDTVMAEVFLKQDGTIVITAATKVVFASLVDFEDGITAKGVNIGEDHKHSGVQPGLGNTGNPI